MTIITTRGQWTLLLVVAVSLLLPAAMFGSGTQEQGEDEPTTVTYFTSQAKWRDVYRDIGDKMAEEENLIIDFQIVPDDQFFSLLKTKLATKEVPDIFQHNAPTEYTTVRASETCVRLNDEPWVSRLVNPDYVKDRDGDIYAMPRQASSFFPAAYYNKEVFDRLGLAEPNPQTYDEFLEILESIKEADSDVTPLFASNKDSWTTQIFMTAAFPIFTEDNYDNLWERILANEVSFSDVPEFQQVLNLYLDLYDRGYVNSDHLSAGYEDAKVAVGTGEAAMLFNGEFAAEAIKAQFPDAELGSFIVPFEDKDMIATGAFVQGWFVPKHGNTEAALRFLELMSQPEYMEMYFEAYPGSSPFEDVDGGEQLPAIQSVVEDYVRTGNYVYEMNAQVAELSPIMSELWRLYQDMVAGGLEPEEVLQQWDAKVADFMRTKGAPGW